MKINAKEYLKTSVDLDILNVSHHASIKNIIKILVIKSTHFIHVIDEFIVREDRREQCLVRFLRGITNQFEFQVL